MADDNTTDEAKPDAPHDVLVDVVAGLDGPGKCQLVAQWHQRTAGHLVVAPDRPLTGDLDNIPTLTLPGCPCCAAHDLLFEAIAAHRAAGADRVLLLTHDVADLPRLVRLFTHRAREGFPARLGHLVTWFSAASLAALPSQGESATGAQHGGGSGAVSEARFRQLELSDVVVVDQLESATRALLERLNPSVTVLAAGSEDHFLDAELGNSERLPGWLQWLVGDRNQDDESVLLFEGRRPFHIGRLRALLAAPLAGILRGHGFVWLSSDMERVANWSRAGRFQTLSPGGKWWATRLPIYWPAEGSLARRRLDERWSEDWGDRRQELVAVGTPDGVETLRAQLDRCLLTDEEMSAGEVVWHTWDDDLPAEGWTFHLKSPVAE